MNTGPVNNDQTHQSVEAPPNPSTVPAAPAKKPWYKRWYGITAIVIGSLAVIGAIGGSDTQTSSSTSSSSPKAKSSTTSSSSAAPAMPGLNQAANDGKFAFTVTSIQCGQAQVGTNEFTTDTAQGQFCLLNISVKNIGSESQSLGSSSQYLYDAQNHKYSADTSATIDNQPSGVSQTWYNDINPGNSVSGTIVFDIPKGVTPTTAELHDSAFSGGVKVKL